MGMEIAGESSISDVPSTCIGNFHSSLWRSNLAVEITTVLVVLSRNFYLHDTTTTTSLFLTLNIQISWFSIQSDNYPVGLSILSKFLTVVHLPQNILQAVEHSHNSICPPGLNLLVDQSYNSHWASFNFQGLSKFRPNEASSWGGWDTQDWQLPPGGWASFISCEDISWVAETTWAKR